MDIRLLGPVRAYAGGEAIDLGPRKQRFVLAVLALEVNRFVPLDRLVELTWPGSPPRTAVHAVRVCTSRLRSVLIGAAQRTCDDSLDLIGQGGGYLLRADPQLVDAHRFRTLVDQARAVTGDAERLDLLDRALALWTGPALTGSAAPDVAERLCRGLEECRLCAVEDRLDVRLRLGQHREVIDELSGLVLAHPGRERLVGQLMLALYRAGRTSDALHTYRQAQRTLAEDLGMHPGPALRELEVTILRGDPAPVDTTDGPGADAPRLLPPPVACFVGRTDELKALDTLLDEYHERGPAVVIAVVGGPAGTGKTALALHWAHRVAVHFPDGQLYVDLRGFDAGGTALSPDTVIRQFLDALGVPAARIPTGPQAQADLYRSRLAGRRVLVLLDNAADVDQIRPLLPGTPGCLVLVTSRGQLTGLVAVEGARPLTLDELSTMDGDRPAPDGLPDDPPQ